MNKLKISVRFVSTLYTRFERHIEATPLGRDAFIEAVLKVELPRLAQAVDDRQLSAEARRYVSRALHALGEPPADGLALVNLAIASDVIRDLKALIKRTNMCRDAVFNRLLLLLVGQPKVLAYLAPRATPVGSENPDEFWSMSESPLERLRDLIADPLKNLHEAARHHWDENLWGVPLPPKWHGLSCWIDDALVPDSEAAKALKKVTVDTEALLRELETAFDVPASNNATSSEGQP